MDHEAALVTAFIVHEKRDRYREFLKNPKKRSQIVDRFCHHFDFIEKYATQIPRTDARSLAKILRESGAGETAWIIGGRSKLDGHEMPLEAALNDGLADPSGLVISCIPGQLALLLREFPPGDVYLLRRSAPGKTGLAPHHTP